MHYNYPAAKFTKTKTIEEQIAHVLSEADEVRRAYEALQDGTGTVDHLEEEIGDLEHSLETLRRIRVRLQGRTGVVVSMQRVVEKNDDRGYYE